MMGVGRDALSGDENVNSRTQNLCALALRRQNLCASSLEDTKAVRLSHSQLPDQD